MDEQAIKQITILIAGRPYPLKIKATDEAAVRKVVQELNEKINRFQLGYQNKDKQDFLAMTALTYAVDMHKLRQTVGATKDKALLERLSHLDNLLDDIMKA
ncbi:MAG: cell division protein ZapA [Bacteroidota bacterium]